MSGPLPAFLGIGAMKAGTTTLHAWLAAHPEVGMAQGRKEVMFFDRHWDRGLAWYQQHFEGVDGVLGEVTPGYLFHPEAAARIRSTVPDVRWIAILRDPVARAISQWRFFVKESGYAGDLDAFLAEHPNAVERGRYAEQLQRYVDRFAPEQGLVLIFEEAMADPATAVRQVYTHVGVDPSFVPEGLGERTNASAVPRFGALYRAGRRAIGWAYAHDLGWAVQATKGTGIKRVFLGGRGKEGFAPVAKATRQRLQAGYAEDVVALEAMLGRSLGEVWPWSR